MVDGDEGGGRGDDGGEEGREEVRGLGGGRVERVEKDEGFCGFSLD